MSTEEQNNANESQSRLTVGLGGPQPDREFGLCKPDCPYLAKWEHPFFYHTAWCWHMMRDLDWYDYWQARCINDQPNAQLLKIRDCGRTKPPNARREPASTKTTEGE